MGRVSFGNTHIGVPIEIIENKAYIKAL